MEFNELSAHDDFVDSWSEGTKKNVAVAILRFSGSPDFLMEK